MRRRVFMAVWMACLGLAVLACDDGDAGNPSDTSTTAGDAGDTTSTTSPDGGSDTSTTTGGDATTAEDGTEADATAQDTSTSDTSASDATDARDTTEPSDATGDVVVPPGDRCRPAPFDEGATYTRRLVVAPGGNDDSGDGSDAAPFATVRRAARDATPGTRIAVQAGTYGPAGFISDLHGTADAPIAIVAEGGAVVFDAGGETEVMHLIEPRYVVLEGLTLQNSRVNGLNIDDGGTFDTPAGPVVLRDLTVRDIGTGGNNDCIKLSGLDDFFVLDSDISECNAGDAIDMVGCHNGVIANNRIYDAAGGGVQAKGGTSDILINGNRFVNVLGRSINAGGATSLEYFRPIDAPYEAARLVMSGNIFVHPGEASGAPVAFVGCDACIFAHNTIIDPQTWLARILQETVDESRFVPSRDGYFVNNIVVFEMGDLRNNTFVNVGDNTAPQTFTFANNLWHATDRPDFTRPTLSGGIPPETGTLVGDPMLDPNYRTMPASMAVGAGSALLASHDLPDYDGRCFDAQAPTVGAFELAD